MQATWLWGAGGILAGAYIISLPTAWLTALKYILGGAALVAWRWACQGTVNLADLSETAGRSELVRQPGKLLTLDGPLDHDFMLTPWLLKIAWMAGALALTVFSVWAGVQFAINSVTQVLVAVFLYGLAMLILRMAYEAVAAVFTLYDATFTSSSYHQSADSQTQDEAQDIPPLVFRFMLASFVVQAVCWVIVAVVVLGTV
jgi:hypothetical protein